MALTYNDPFALICRVSRIRAGFMVLLVIVLVVYNMNKKKGTYVIAEGYWVFPDVLPVLTIPRPQLSTRCLPKSSSTPLAFSKGVDNNPSLKQADSRRSAYSYPKWS